ncbi:MAG: ABC transporter permease subunit [Ktedonobacterales bacterium]|nr:ABC transporter permease subunit [Ktedonobacterales bacterium]
MNATLTTGASFPQPNFVGMVRGELFKLVRQRAVVISAIVVTAFFILYTLRLSFYLSALQSVQNNVGPDGGVTVPNGTVAYSMVQLLLSDVRGLIGIFIMIATVSCIALEYQQGTIRVMLARGVGRLRLLGAKLTALGLVSLVVLVVLLLLSVVMAYVDVSLAYGNTDQLSVAPPYLWSDALTGLLAVLMNMAMTLLFAAMFAVLGRSLAFGFIFTVPYFLVEGIISGILTVVSLVTKNPVWTNITTYFLGTNLTNLASALLPNRGLDLLSIINRGSAALGPSVDATHTLLVILAYFAIFTGLAGYLTWKRDVLQ